MLVIKYIMIMHHLVLRFAASLASMSLDTRRLLGCECACTRGSDAGFNMACVRSRSFWMSEYDDSSLWT